MAEFEWLKSLPLAPEYHPTESEFQDPISYIFNIEREASQYGFCKIIPPLSPAPKVTAVTNFNRSLAAINPGSDHTFTTYQQRIGIGPNKCIRGGRFNFKEFEAKAKKFEKSYLKGSGRKGVSELEIETLFWKAFGSGSGSESESDTFLVDYANVPGSAFVPINGKKLREAGEVTTVGETSWNMRGVSRAKGSLLRLMKEEMPGLTSPMVGLGMLFSWVGWHVEDHDLHGLSYIHMGAGKTWYGVPKDAAAAFEEVVRVHEYGEEVDPLVSCATLAEKTTVMSPKVLVHSGVPCCRLVQNAGEFVVTFPRAYCYGFSHGFNCAEATNVATPEWLKVAKAAAVRRASIKLPPLLSHFQLLYALALSLYSRIPLMSIGTEPRSSRLKERTRGEGETMVKELFLQDVIQNNELLHILLEQGSSCVLLPQNSSNILCSNIHVGSKAKTHPRYSLGICNHREEMGDLKISGLDDNLLDENAQHRQLNGFRSMRRHSGSVREGNRSSFSAKYLQYKNADLCSSTTEIHDTSAEKESCCQSGGILDYGMLSCIKCGILTFACAAVIHPREEAAQCSMSNDTTISSEVPDCEYTDANWCMNTSELNSCSGQVGNSDHDEIKKGISSLDLLAVAYGYSSDSEDERIGHGMLADTDGNNTAYNQMDRSESAHEVFSSESDNNEVSALRPSACCVHSGKSTANMKGRGDKNPENSPQREMTKCNNLDIAIKDSKVPFEQRAVRYSSKNHIFCLEHATEVEKQLRSIGGVHVLLVCHPDYPVVETEARALAEEQGFDYQWKDISFREATEDDHRRIQSALNSDKAVTTSGDWAAKGGFHLSYSLGHSQSPPYSKQMPYNNSIGFISPTNSSVKPRLHRKRPRRPNKIVVGKWCGKVWMSNQVHPYLAQAVSPEEEALVTFNLQAKPESEVKIESEPELIDQTELPLPLKERSLLNMIATVTRKSGRTRKGSFSTEPSKKPKCSQIDCPSEAVEYSPIRRTTLQSGMTLRRGQRKRKNTERYDLYVKQEAASGDDTDCRNPCTSEKTSVKPVTKKQSKMKAAKTLPTRNKYKAVKDEEEEYPCDIEECTMVFSSKQDLLLHKRNICLIDGCGKKFLSHEYLDKHRRVHIDDRPLKCPWKGCKRTFKWAWARTEHIRVHTGERPYECPEPGCGQTFRFVTDFGRHRRLTGHSKK